MPNIEAWGFGDNSDKIRTKIARVIPVGLNDDVVITVVKSSVIDMYGRQSPFLRVWDTKDTDKNKRSELIEGLKTLGWDIELAPFLMEFIPAE